MSCPKGRPGNAGKRNYPPLLGKLHWFLCLLALSFTAPSAALAESDGKLAARPDPIVSLKYPPGVTKLSNDALLYRPSELGQGPHPLIVLVHGYPQRATQILDWFKPSAEREKVLLLAVQSRGRRWDLVPDPDRRISSRMRPNFEFGPDVPRIDEVLFEVFSAAPVDPARVVILGFSDGASYALSLGLANYELFRSIIALSPGFVRVPGAVLPSQRIVIASGTSDRMLPYEVVAEKIVPLLVENGLKPRFCSFEGGHSVHLRQLREALGYALGRAASRSEPGESSGRPFHCVSY